MDNDGKIGFGENGQPVLVTAFDFDALQGDLAESEQVRLWADGALAMLAMINAGSSVERAGRRARLIAFFLGRSVCKTQKELAGKLGITPAATSQQLNQLHTEFAQMRDIFARSQGRT